MVCHKGEPMDEVELSDAIACSLAWFHPQRNEPTFLEYLSRTYSETITVLPRFEKLCLAEAAYGDAKKGEIGGIIKRWWLADDDGCRAIPWHELPRWVDDFNEAERTDRTYYQYPLVKFLREGLIVTFGEAFGPMLACRKVARVQQSAEGISIIDVRLVWNTKSIRSVSPLVQSPALEIGKRRCNRTLAPG
jgi:hypothetical protein